MIYVPILKTRRQEYSIAREMKDCFSDKMIPMFEIISEKYEIKYLVDEETGEFIYEKKGKRNYRIKKPQSPEDIITLQHINNVVDGKKVFVDYFRFSLEKYGRNIDINRAELSLKLNSNYNLYKEKVLAVSLFDNMIPVISVKKEFDIPKKELENFMRELQSKNASIALRITEKWLESYKDIMKEQLRNTDYLLFDIEEQNPETKFMELEELMEIELDARIVLVNSPRKAAIRNGEYPERGETDLIINSARMVAIDSDLDGYGDYCGLKDQMPMNDGANGTGAALALFFDYNKNSFYSYANHDTSLGMKGYYTLIPQIKEDENFLDPLKDCPGFKKVKKLESCGGWPTWHHINAVRYIHQTYKNL